MNKAPSIEPVPVVLVVDDEPLIRIFTVQVLQEAGFEVEEAGNSDEALKRLDGHSVKALVTDVDMPGRLDGCGLAWEVHDRWPGAALLIISGVTKPDTDDLPPNARFLSKPMAPERLVKELTQALSETL